MVSETLTKTRYNEQELNEFRELIKEKISAAREELRNWRGR